VARAWYLSKVTQPGGANYSLSYGTDNSTGETTLSKISYGSHSVSFTYEERPDRAFGYDAGGAKFGRTKRLSSISTTGSAQHIATYSFKYGYNARVDQSYLTDVQKCVGSSCYAPISFAWNSLSTTLVDSTIHTESISRDHNYKLAVGDVDGNGTADIVGYEESGNSQTNRLKVYKSSRDPNINIDSGTSISIQTDGVSSGPYSSLMVSDLDSDGVDDIAWYTGIKIQAYLSDGNLAVPSTKKETGVKHSRQPQLVDVNGDGILDNVQYYPEVTKNYLHVFTGVGDGTFKSEIRIAKRDTKSLFSFGDFDGDGKSDILIYHDKSNLEVFYGSGSKDAATFSGAYSIDIGSTAMENISITTSDINGDGLADVVVSDKDTKELKIYRSKGRSFETTPFVYANIDVKEDKKPSLRFTDINGDGRSDFIQSGKYSLGQIDGSLGAPITSAGIPEVSSDDNLAFVDIDGDGARDILKYQENTASARYLYIQKGTQAGLQITSFQDSNDQSVYVTYKNIVDHTVYSRSKPVSYKSGISSVLNPSTMLVAQTSNTEGDIFYKYGGAQSSLDEGYLGFQAFASVSERESSDSAGIKSPKSIVAVTYLNQTGSLIGKSYEVYKRVKSGTSATVINNVALVYKEENSSITGLYYGGGVPEELTEGSASSLAEAETRALNAGRSFTSGVTMGESASTHTQTWEEKDLGSSITRPVLTATSATYYDPELGSDIIGFTSTTTNWSPVISPGLIVRPTDQETVQGLGNTIKKTRVDYQAYLNNGLSSPQYLVRNLLPTKEKVTTTALGTTEGEWGKELYDNGLPTSQFHYVNKSYTSNNLLNLTYVTGRGENELQTAIVYDYIGNPEQVTVKNLTGGNFDSVISRVSKQTHDDTTGFLLSETNAQGHLTTYADHDKYGNPKTVTSGSANNTTQDLVALYEYDSFGRNTKATKPSGEVVTTTYSDCTSSSDGCVAGNLKTFVKTSSNQGGESYSYFNTRGLNVRNAVEIFGGNYVVTATDYDNHQRVNYTTAPVEVSNLSNPVTLGDPQNKYYDVLDQLVRSTDGAGGITKIEWDYLGNGVNERTTSVLVDGSNYRTTVETYNPLNQLISSKAENGTYTQFLYDLNGNVIRQWYSKADYSEASPEANTGSSKANSHVIVKTYDAQGRMISENDPDKGITAYEYWPHGDVKTVTNARAAALEEFDSQTYSYDLLGRLTVQANEDGMACYFYDEVSAGKSVGQLTESRYYRSFVPNCDIGNKADGFYSQSKYSYNSNGFLEEQDQFISGADTYYTNYQYSTKGQPASKSWTGGDGGALSVNYGYDSYSGQLTTIDDGTKTHWQLTDVDALGNARGVTLGGLFNVVKDYNANTGTLTNVTAKSGSNTLLNLGYTYNNNGFVTELTDAANTTGNWSAYKETYHYGDNVKRQLTAVDVQNGAAPIIPSAFQYKYDALGNIRWATGMNEYTYSDVNPHRVISVNGNTYAYDINDISDEGNVTNDGRRALTYGHNHLPTRITQGSSISTDYVYSADNSLLYRKDTNGSTIQENWYFGDMQYTKKDGSIERVYSIAAGVTIVVDDGAGSDPEAQYSVSNNIGSTVLTLKDTGEIKQRLRYDAFGKARIVYDSDVSSTINEWSGFTSKEGFTGHEHMYDLDLIHMKGRIYDPTTGRFLQADVIVQAPQQILSYNRYAYVWNNPLVFVDPSGYVCGCPADVAENSAPLNPNQANSDLDIQVNAVDIGLYNENDTTPGNIRNEVMKNRNLEFNIIPVSFNLNNFRPNYQVIGNFTYYEPSSLKFPNSRVEQSLTDLNQTVVASNGSIVEFVFNFSRTFDEAAADLVINYDSEMETREGNHRTDAAGMVERFNITTAHNGIHEADMKLTMKGSGYSEKVMAHEVGHFIGLHHQDNRTDHLMSYSSDRDYSFGASQTWGFINAYY